MDLSNLIYIEQVFDIFVWIEPDAPFDNWEMSPSASPRLNKSPITKSN